MGISILPIIGVIALLVFNPIHGPSNAAPAKVTTSVPLRIIDPNVAPKSDSPVEAAVVKSDCDRPVEISGTRLDTEKELTTIYEFITVRYKKVHPRDAVLISRYLVDYGRKHDLDPKFAAALIARESGFNKRAVSRTGAKGLGQIKDFNFSYLRIRDPYDIHQNVRGTVSYLKWLLTRWEGPADRPALALASYFRGPNAIKRSNGQFDDQTTRYVADIMRSYDELRSIRERMD